MVSKGNWSSAWNKSYGYFLYSPPPPNSYSGEGLGRDQFLALMRLFAFLAHLLLTHHSIFFFSCPVCETQA